MAGSNKILGNNQMDLLGAGDEAETGECELAPLPLENSQFLDDGGHRTKVRRPGRPQGSRNKRGVVLQKWLLSLGYQHPAVILAEITARPVEELAVQLSCTRLEAFQEQRKAASDLLPYFEGRILPKTDEGEQALPQLHIHLTDDQVGLNGQKTIDQEPIQVAQKLAENSEILERETLKSHGQVDGELPSD